MILRLLVTPPSSLSSLRRLMSNHRPILRRTLPRKRLHPTGAYCFPLLYRVSYIYDMNLVISVGREREKEGGKEQVHEGQRKGKGQNVMAVVVALPVLQGQSGSWGSCERSRCALRCTERRAMALCLLVTSLSSPSSLRRLMSHHR